jgi:hypothetical protein
MTALNDTLALCRSAIIRLLVNRGEMPTIAQLATELAVSGSAAAELLRQLQAEHALLLDHDGSIRMLWPFSGVPTVFRVSVNNRNYWANCAWDALGIPAALQADAVIHAEFAYPQAPVTLYVQGDTVSAGSHLVHFPLPVSRWYDDLVYT